MFFLVTGASGVGKSTVRQILEPVLAPQTVCVELSDVATVPAVPDVAWRQRATEFAVRRAIALQAAGRHLLLSGDPVAAGEVLAAPSADDLDAVAICLLDARPRAQEARLRRRGDDPSALPLHVGFADWMRGHARDPQHVPHVLTEHGWDEMRWERWISMPPGDDRWRMEIVDTSQRSPGQVAEEVESWHRRALAGDAHVFRAGWWRAARPAT